MSDNLPSRTLARIRRSRRSGARRAAGEEVPAGEGPERPGLRARARRGGRQLRARARAAARHARRRAGRGQRPQPPRRRRFVAGQLVAIPDARRSKRDRERLWLSPRPTWARSRCPTRSTCGARGTRSRDQGETASCVGWAVADSCLRWQLVEAGRLDPDQRLSARYVWMSAKETDQREEYPSTFLEYDGTSLKAGLDVVRKCGVRLEEELAWEGGLATIPPEQFNRSARRRRIMAYFNLHGGRGSLRRVAHVAAPERPGARADRAGHELPHLLRRPRRPSTPTRSTAATPRRCTATRPSHFLLRSSWGTDWGDEGYARLEPRLRRAGGDRELRRDGLSLVGDPRRHARQRRARARAAARG